MISVGKRIKVTTELEAPPSIQVAVVYALPERYWTVPLRLPHGCTVATALQAVELAQILELWAADPARLAIFSRPVELATVLRDGDRLELLRPLAADPKQSRRDRAAGATSRGTRAPDQAAGESALDAT